MIKAKHTFFCVRFFDFYSKFKLKRHFKAIHIHGNPDLLSDKPMLMIANHFSWWDGFIQILLNNALLNKRFHVMMLEEQLRKNMILNKGGAFSIKKGSRDVIESLNYSIHLLKDKDNMVLMFPQGEIQSIYTSYFVFERGLQYLFTRLHDSVQLAFNVNLIDYFSDKQPTLNIYYTPYTINEDTSLADIEAAFNDFARDCMKQQQPQDK